ncbi:Uncharacterised protein [Burkholderia pseudomallei]|nr:Uncharacterised protein [Burkholderia pseudomallei]
MKDAKVYEPPAPAVVCATDVDVVMEPDTVIWYRSSAAPASAAVPMMPMVDALVRLSWLLPAVPTPNVSDAGVSAVSVGVAATVSMVT